MRYSKLIKKILEFLKISPNFEKDEDYLEDFDKANVRLYYINILKSQ